MSQMSFKTESPISLAVKVCELAFNASKTTGLGMLHFKPGPMSPETHNSLAGQAVSGRISLDYVEGRMVKLILYVTKDSVEYSDSVPSPDYQSWATTYPTCEALVKAAAKELGL